MSNGNKGPSPLTTDHYHQLNQCIANCAQNQEWIERAKKAGVPVDHLEQQNKLHHETASGLKREFFPEMP